MQNGVLLGWLIDPDGREIMEFALNAIPRVLPKVGFLEGHDMLPGFRYSVAEVFEWLKE
jgi:Uma2 family endonuclease